jgi:hypothetical protein
MEVPELVPLAERRVAADSIRSLVFEVERHIEEVQVDDRDRSAARAKRCRDEADSG